MDSSDTTEDSFDLASLSGSDSLTRLRRSIVEPVGITTSGPTIGDFGARVQSTSDDDIPESDSPNTGPLSPHAGNEGARRRGFVAAGTSRDDSLHNSTSKNTPHSSSSPQSSHNHSINSRSLSPGASALRNPFRSPRHVHATTPGDGHIQHHSHRSDSPDHLAGSTESSFNLDEEYENLSLMGLDLEGTIHSGKSGQHRNSVSQFTFGDLEDTLNSKDGDGSAEKSFPRKKGGSPTSHVSADPGGMAALRYALRRESKDPSAMAALLQKSKAMSPSAMKDQVRQTPRGRLRRLARKFQFFVRGIYALQEMAMDPAVNDLSRILKYIGNHAHENMCYYPVRMLASFAKDDPINCITLANSADVGVLLSVLESFIENYNSFLHETVVKHIFQTLEAMASAGVGAKALRALNCEERVSELMSLWPADVERLLKKCASHTELAETYPLTAIENMLGECAISPTVLQHAASVAAVVVKTARANLSETLTSSLISIASSGLASLTTPVFGLEDGNRLINDSMKIIEGIHSCEQCWTLVQPTTSLISSLIEVLATQAEDLSSTAAEILSSFPSNSFLREAVSQKAEILSQHIGGSAPTVATAIVQMLLMVLASVQNPSTDPLAKHFAIDAELRGSLSEAINVNSKQHGDVHQKLASMSIIVLMRLATMTSQASVREVAEVARVAASPNSTLEQVKSSLTTLQVLVRHRGGWVQAAVEVRELRRANDSPVILGSVLLRICKTLSAEPGHEKQLQTAATGIKELAEGNTSENGAFQGVDAVSLISLLKTQANCGDATKEAILQTVAVASETDGRYLSQLCVGGKPSVLIDLASQCIHPSSTNVVVAMCNIVSRLPGAPHPELGLSLCRTLQIFGVNSNAMKLLQCLETMALTSTTVIAEFHSKGIVGQLVMHSGSTSLSPGVLSRIASLLSVVTTNELDIDLLKRTPIVNHVFEVALSETGGAVSLAEDEYSRVEKFWKSLREDIEAEEKAEAERREQMISVLAQLEELREELAKSKEDFDTLEKDHSTVKKELEDRAAELENATASLAEFESKLQSQQTFTEDVQAQLEQESTLRQQLTAEHEAVKLKLSQQEEENKHVTKSLQEAIAEQEAAAREREEEALKVEVERAKADQAAHDAQELAKAKEQWQEELLAATTASTTAEEANKDLAKKIEEMEAELVELRDSQAKATTVAESTVAVSPEVKEQLEKEAADATQAKEELARVTKELEESKAKQAALTAKNGELNVNLKKLTDEHATAQAVTSENESKWKIDIAALEEKLKASATEVADLQASVKKLETDAKILAEEENAKHAEALAAASEQAKGETQSSVADAVQEVKAKLLRRDAELSVTKDSLEAATSELKRAQEELEQLRSDAAEAKTALEQSDARLSAQLDEHTEKLSVELTLEQTARAEAEASHKKAKKELSDANLKKKKLSAEVDKKTADLQAIEQKHEEQQLEVSQLKDQCTGLHEELKERGLRVTQLLNDHHDAKEKLKRDHNKQVKSMQTKLDEREEKMHKYKASLKEEEEAKEALRVDLTQKIETLESDLSDIRSKEASVSKKYAHAKERLVEEKAQREKMREAHDAAVVELSKVEEKLNGSQDKVKELERQVAKQRMNHEHNLKEQRRTLEEKMSNASHRSNVTSARQVAAVADIKNQLVKLQNEVIDRRDTEERLQANLTALRSDKDAAERAHISKVEELTEEISTLRSEIERRQQSLADKEAQWRDEHSTTASQHEQQLTMAVHDLERKHRAATQALTANHKLELQSAKEESETLQEKVAELETQLNDRPAPAKMEKLHKQFAELSAKYDSALRSQMALSKVNREVEEEAVVLKSRVEGLTERNSMLETAVDDLETAAVDAKNSEQEANEASEASISVMKRRLGWAEEELKRTTVKLIAAEEGRRMANLELRRRDAADEFARLAKANSHQLDGGEDNDSSSCRDVVPVDEATQREVLATTTPTQRGRDKQRNLRNKLHHQLQQGHQARLVASKDPKDQYILDLATALHTLRREVADAVPGGYPSDESPSSTPRPQGGSNHGNKLLQHSAKEHWARDRAAVVDSFKVALESQKRSYEGEISALHVKLEQLTDALRAAHSHSQTPPPQQRPGTAHSANGNGEESRSVSPPPSRLMLDGPPCVAPAVLSSQPTPANDCVVSRPKLIFHDPMIISGEEEQQSGKKKSAKKRRPASARVGRAATGAVTTFPSDAINTVFTEAWAAENPVSNNVAAANRSPIPAVSSALQTTPSPRPPHQSSSGSRHKAQTPQSRIYSHYDGFNKSIAAEFRRADDAAPDDAGVASGGGAAAAAACNNAAGLASPPEKPFVVTGGVGSGLQQYNAQQDPHLKTFFKQRAASAAARKKSPSARGGSSNTARPTTATVSRAGERSTAPTNNGKTSHNPPSISPRTRRLSTNSDTVMALDLKRVGW